MAAPKKLKVGAHGPPEADQSEVRWLISYSDFMMQLVCLFILLYSVSTIDMKRAATMASAYRDSKGLGGPPAIKKEQGIDVKLRSEGEVSVGDVKLIGGKLGRGELPPGVLYRAKEVPEGWLLSFPEPIFAVGSAELTPEAQAGLDQVAALLRAYVGGVFVNGFVDSDPADTMNGDGLRLAQVRAENVVSHLTRSGFARALDPRRVQASGRGIGDVQRGRRVEILLRVK